MSLSHRNICWHAADCEPMCPSWQLWTERKTEENKFCQADRTLHSVLEDGKEVKTDKSVVTVVSNESIWLEYTLIWGISIDWKLFHRSCHLDLLPVNLKDHCGDYCTLKQNTAETYHLLMSKLKPVTHSLTFSLTTILYVSFIDQPKV